MKSNTTESQNCCNELLIVQFRLPMSLQLKNKTHDVVHSWLRCFEKYECTPSRVLFFSWSDIRANEMKNV